MSLFSLEAQRERLNKGKEFEILDAEGTPTGIFFTIAGPHSEAQMAAQRKLADTMSNELLVSPARVAGTLASFRSDAALEALTACVLAWRGVEEKHNTPLPCTSENVLRVLRAYPWVRQQVDRIAADERAFRKEPA